MNAQMRYPEKVPKKLHDLSMHVQDAPSLVARLGVLHHSMPYHSLNYWHHDVLLVPNMSLQTCP